MDTYEISCNMTIHDSKMERTGSMSTEESCVVLEKRRPDILLEAYLPSQADLDVIGWH